MYKGLKVAAIVAAAGQGRRIGGAIKKQYMLIKDKPILAKTLEVLDSVDLIDHIIITTGEGDIEYCLDNIVNKYCIKKVINIVKGGNERQQSIMNGLSALKGICDIVVIHDGVRPFATADIIKKSISEAYKYGAAACAVPVKDTIKVVNDDNFIINTPDRSKLYAIQTPQTFMFDTIYKAHIQAQKDDFTGTDDTVLLERIGKKVRLFEGSYENIKVTTPEDIYFAQAIINYRENKDKEERL